MRLRNTLRLLVLRALLSLMPDEEDEVTDVRPAPIKRWSPVHSARGKFIHMCHDGRNTLCGVRLRTLVAVPDQEVDCFECYQALTFN